MKIEVHAWSYPCPVEVNEEAYTNGSSVSISKYSQNLGSDPLSIDHMKSQNQKRFILALFTITTTASFVNESTKPGESHQDQFSPLGQPGWSGGESSSTNRTSHGMLQVLLFAGECVKTSENEFSQTARRTN